MDQAQQHAKLVGYLSDAQKVLIFTGAGISTGSGIPDYRGPKGVWKTRQPVYYQDFMSSHASRVEYWNQKSEGWAKFRDAEANAVHRAVARLEQAGCLLMCVTQNIDGLHSKGGVSNDRLIEIHGTNREIECQSCHRRSDPQAHFDAFTQTEQPPKCADCDGWLKPATISFGQSLRQADMDRAASATEQCDLVIALGSTLSVHPAASIPIVAAQRGVPYVIINRGHTDQDGLPIVSLRMEGDVVELFAPAVDEALTDEAPD
jgi:NAD-dependent deacetylase